MTAQRLWARVSLCCRNNYSLPRSLKTTWIVNFIASSLCDFCSTCLFGLRLRLETTLQDKEYCRVFSISRYQKTCQEGTASRACLCGACVNNCWIWKFSISAFDVVLRVGTAIFFCLSIYLCRYFLSSQSLTMHAFYWWCSRSTNLQFFFSIVL